MLSAIQFVVSIILIAILLRYNEGFWGTLGLASVLGGAIGNLFDRVVHGYVVDMFRFIIFPNFAIFNIADIFITLGGITFCIYFIISSVRSGVKGDSDADYTQDEDYRDEDYDDFDERYDQYELQDEPDEAAYDRLSDTRVIPGKRKARGRETKNYYEPVQEPQDYYEPVETVQDYYEPVELAQDYYEPAETARDYYEPVQESPEDIPSTLDALGALESELGNIEDYDIEDILREYGFDGDNK